MSKILIENYKGWEIYFDNAKENFYTSSDEYDRMNTKTSYAATKKWIDDFIKENLVFEPVMVETEGSIYNDSKKIKIIGIRKDLRFIYEGKDGKPQQMSEYDEKDYYLTLDENNPIYEQIQKLDAERERLFEQISNLRKHIVKKFILKEIKEKYKNNP